MTTLATFLELLDLCAKQALKGVLSPLEHLWNSQPSACLTYDIYDLLVPITYHLVKIQNRTAPIPTISGVLVTPYCILIYKSVSSYCSHTRENRDSPRFISEPESRGKCQHTDGLWICVYERMSSKLELIPLCHLEVLRRWHSYSYTVLVKSSCRCGLSHRNPEIPNSQPQQASGHLRSLSSSCHLRYKVTWDHPMGKKTPTNG